MAKEKLQKIRITGLKRHYKILMRELHRKGNLEIVENEKFIDISPKKIDQHFDVFDLARLDFALKFLEPDAPKQAFLEKLFTGGALIMKEEEAKKRLKEFSPISEKIVTECEEIEFETGKATQELKRIDDQRASFLPLKSLQLPLQASFKTKNTGTIIGSLDMRKKDLFVRAISQESRLVNFEFFGKKLNQVYFRVTFHNDSTEKLQEVLRELEAKSIDFSSEYEGYLGSTVREVLRELDKKEKLLHQKIKKNKEMKKALAKYVDDLKILYDYNVWRKRKHDLQRRILRTNKVFAFEAWVAAAEQEKLSNWIEKSFVKEVSLDNIEPEKDEVIPALFTNKTGISSFEFITEMYGIPTNDDLDPTPFLAPFFFVFFGLCLSDVGYGAILFLAAFVFYIFGTFSSEAKKGLLLMVMCGFSAVLGGVALGSYFGLTVAQVQELVPFLMNPAYSATTEGVMPFVGQLIDLNSNEGPIIFLQAMLGLGVIHLLFGLLLDTYRNIKIKKYATAFFDPFSWFIFVGVLCVYGIADKIGLDAELMKNIVIGVSIFMIIGQSRDTKNWILKPIMGALALFNITGYLSDILSYSRIMALGLATGVIGFAMNLTAGILKDMIPNPFIGILVAVVVILFGHSLNFALSLLGAFVHTGRLQFIEFFGKFFDGNGRKFKPFKRQKKYLFFRQ